MGHTKHHLKHKHKKGGGAMAGRDDYAGSGEPNVVKEAHEMKHGGHVHGHKGKHRIKKKRGGSVGSDHHPFSSAGGGGMHDHPAHGGHGDSHGGSAFKK